MSFCITFAKFGTEALIIHNHSIFQIEAGKLENMNFSKTKTVPIRNTHKLSIFFFKHSYSIK